MDLLKASLTHVVAVLVVVSLVAASAVVPAQLQPTQQHQHQQQRNRSEPFDSLPPGNDTSSNMTHSSDITTDAISVRCPRSQFFHHHDRKCKPCSSCPVNQIIRRPCSARSDTFCGPFVEFDEFHQRPEQSPPEVDHSSYHKKHKGKIFFCVERGEYSKHKKIYLKLYILSLRFTTFTSEYWCEQTENTETDF